MNAYDAYMKEIAQQMRGELLTLHAAVQLD